MSPPTATRLLALLSFLAGACGSGSQAPPSPPPSSSTPRLSELLAVPEGQDQPAAGPSNAPSAPSGGSAPSLEDLAGLSGPAPQQEEDAPSVSKECQEAREALKRARERLAERQARELPPLEKKMLAAEAAYRQCIMGEDRSCMDDGKRVVALKEALDQARQRYEQVQQRFLQAEAELHPLVVAEERACGRR